MKVAEVTAQKRCISGSHFLFHQQVMELEAILVEVWWEIWRHMRFRGAGGPFGSKGTSGSSKNVYFGGDE